jgi:hypothetical protein
MVPGDVVGVHHPGARERGRQPAGQGGLAAGPAAVDREQDGPAAAQSGDEFLHHGERHHAPLIGHCRTMPAIRLIDTDADAG